jgi:hypothetical protein
MLKSILKLDGVKAIDKATQKSITGSGGGYCCEWCSDGSCNGWVSSLKVTCPFAAPCS